MRSSRITLSLAALSLSTALLALPALAQDNSSQTTNKTSQNASSPAKTDKAQAGTNQKQAAQPSQAGSMKQAMHKSGHMKSARMGGGISTAQAQKGAERTGSLSNREAFRSGQETYSGGQDQAQASGFKYPTGRGANDGGLTVAQAQKGAERTGSTSSREAFRSGNETYAFGPQGQAPQHAPGAYGTTNGLYAQAPSQYHYSMGRNANDGGFVSSQQPQQQRPQRGTKGPVPMGE